MANSDHEAVRQCPVIGRRRALGRPGNNGAGTSRPTRVSKRVIAQEALDRGVGEWWALGSERGGTKSRS